MGETVPQEAANNNKVGSAMGGSTPFNTGSTPLTGSVRARSGHGKFTRSEPLLRFVSLVFTLLALILLVTDKETESIPVDLPGLSTPLLLTKSARFSDVRALKYYAGSLAVVAGYLLLQVFLYVLSFIITLSPERSKAKAWFTFIGDQSMAYFLASAAAVATEVAYLAEQGEGKIGWNEVCTQFGHFCTVYGVSVVSSYLALLAIFVLAAISAYHVFIHYGCPEVVSPSESRKTAEV